MTNDDKLRIYAAYLPYKLKVKTINIFKGDPIFNLDVSSKKIENCDIDWILKEPENFKPVLYPLEFLTKEIEHEGKMIIPMVELIKIIEFEDTYFDESSFEFNVINLKLGTNRVFQIRYKTDYDNYRDVRMLNFHENEQCLWHTDKKIPIKASEKLLEYHLNVFQLPESEYINKATLTNK